MIFGKLVKTNEKKDIGATSKMSDPKYFMPLWCPSALTRSQKHKLQRLRVRENREKEAEKIFNDTHPQFMPPQKRWRPKAVEINTNEQEAIKIKIQIQLYKFMLVRRTIRPHQSDRPAPRRIVRS